MTHSKLIIKDLPDAQAAKGIEQALLSIRGVESATVNFEAGTAVVAFDPVKAGLDDIIEAIHTAGYDAAPDEQESPSDLFLPEALIDPDPSSSIAPVIEDGSAEDLKNQHPLVVASIIIVDKSNVPSITRLKFLQSTMSPTIR